MKTLRDLLIALDPTGAAKELPKSLPALDYEVSIVRTDEEGETHDVGAPEKVEFNHETGFVVIHAVTIGC